MKAEWEAKRLGDLVLHSAFGPRFSGESYSSAGNVATLRTTDISNSGEIEYNTMPIARLDLERFSQHLLRPGDLVVSRSGRVGTAAVFDGFSMPVLPGAFLIRFRMNECLANPEFYRYFFNSPVGRVLTASIATGSVQQNINISSMNQLWVPVPPLEIQKGIVDVLGTLDDKIELNRKMNETLEEIARTLFTSWFVNFDPVKAKAAGEKPFGMDEATAALFPDSFIDSELGPIPKGWKVGAIADEFTLTMGQSPPGHTYNTEGNGLPFYQGRADFGSRFPTRRVYCTAPTRFANAGDTLLSVRAPVGDINVASESCAIGRGVAALRHNSGSVGFTFQTLRQLRTQLDVFQGEGTVFGSINKQALSGLRIIEAPEDVVTAFETIVAPMDELIESKTSEMQTLAEIRDTLLPKLLSGELRVPEAERITEEVGV